MMLKSKCLLAAVSIAGITLLGGCNHNSASSSGGGLFSSGCSGSYSEQLACYVKQYQSDKTAMQEADDRCQTPNGKLVECSASRMVKDAPKTIKWLNQPEPYPNKTTAFFKNTSDQIRIDEKGWCIASAYANEMFESTSDSCFNMIGMVDGSKKVSDAINRMVTALK